MKKYKVTLYPNVNDFEVVVEADNIEEAIKSAEENRLFTEADVEEI